MRLEEFSLATRSLLDGVTTMTLATCDGGVPWATDVYFAADGFDLVFFSSPASRHCRNLAASPLCAATIHPAVNAWREIKGLQMEGSAGPLTNLGGTARGLAAYLAKFPFAGELLANPGETARRVNSAMLYAFRPTRILLLDNALGFGTRHGMGLVDGQLQGCPERDSRE